MKTFGLRKLPRPEGTREFLIFPCITRWYKKRFKKRLTANPQGTAAAFVVATSDPSKDIEDMADNYLTRYTVTSLEVHNPVVTFRGVTGSIPAVLILKKLFQRHPQRLSSYFAPWDAYYYLFKTANTKVLACTTSSCITH